MTGAEASVDPEPCDLCGSGGAMAPVLEVSLAAVLAVWIHRCARCGFRQVRPRLDPGVLPRLYSSDYFDSASPVGYRDYARQARRRRREAWFLDRWLRRHAPHGPVLEVGCALGFLLAALRDEGHDVAGVDVSPFAAHYATTRLKLDVRAGTLDQAAFPDAAFACVVQKDLLEHVVDPRRHLMETRRILGPGGWLILVTPNGEANVRPLEAASRHAPDRRLLPLVDQSHLSFFAPEHLRRLFESCGFEIVRARSVGLRRGLRALGWLPGQARFTRLVPREPEPAAAPGGDEEASRFEALADRIEQEIAARRGSPESPLFHRLHRVSKWVDELPGAIGIGYDFEFHLRRR